MTVVSCQRFKVVFDAKHQDDILRRFATWGNLEPESPYMPLFENSDLSIGLNIKHIKDKYVDVINYLDLQITEPHDIKSSDLDKKLETIFKNYDSTIEKLDNLVTYVDKIQIAKDNLRSFEEKTSDLLKLLDKVSDIDLPIFKEQELFNLKIVSVPSQQIKKLEELVKEKKEILLTPIHKEVEESYFAVVLPKKFDKKEYEEMSTSLEFHEINIEKSLQNFTPKKLLFEINSRLNNFKKQLENISQQALAEYQKNIATYKCVVDLLDYEEQVSGLYRYIGFYTGTLSKEEAEKLPMLRRGKKFEISVWIEPTEIDSFKKMVKEIGGEIIIEEQASPVEETRTIIKNNKYIKPFEVITKLMGVPSTKEIDPTPYFSPFFILFFGFALGDAGYGLLMLLIVGYLFKKGGLGDSVKEALLLMLYCSVSTIFFGAITGSWFGANLNIIPGSFGEFLRQLKLFDLQQSLILVLVGSIATGFIHQIVGLVLEAVVYIKNKDYLSAFAYPGTWIIFLSALVFKGYTSMFANTDLITQLSTNILYASFGIFLIGQGIKARPFPLIPLMGLTQLFNITGFISNSLSYARLLALGLATGVIASVINFLANLFGGTDSILGIIITIVVLILGHSVNIALNLLGTFINVLRLQLVEFFPRFFQATGIELSPYKLTSFYFSFSKQMYNTYSRNFPIIITNLRKKIL